MMKYKNGFFQLIPGKNGTYLKLFPRMEDGKDIRLNDVVDYFNEIKFTEYSIGEIKKAIENVSEPKVIRLSKETIEPVPEVMRIKVSDDKLKAVARFYPPSPGGKLLNKELIMDIIQHEHIQYGIIEGNIDAFLKRRVYCKTILLAKGKEVEQGTQAEITYHFETEQTNKPKILEDGTVDFHQLNNINHVAKGDLLATLKPAVQGTPGMTVDEKPIAPATVPIRKLKFSKNMHLSEDETQLFSDVSGHVYLLDDKVFVSDMYEVPADVDASTGDIEYDGNVTVKGNVRTGFSVKATGDIYVNGVVEGATIEAGGQVVLKRGMQGMNRGTISCGGDLVTKFIENSTVESKGEIRTDAILHSNVSAKGDILVSGRRGLIIGGEAKSATKISLKTGGSTMGTPTVLEVGVDPDILERYKVLETTLSKESNQLSRLEEIFDTYRHKAKNGEKIAQDKLQYLQLLKNQYDEIKKHTNQIEGDISGIAQLIQDNQNGCVEVSNLVYPGVKLVISNNIQFIREETHYCRFVKDGADIKSVGL